MSNNIRMLGMASGLDTESIINQLMSVERLKLDKTEQKIQLTEWRMEAYRGVTTKLQDFSKKYMDLLSSGTNMQSLTNYKQYKTAITNVSTGKASEAVKIRTSSEMVGGEHRLSISSVATSTTLTSQRSVSSAINGTSEITNFDMTDKSLDVMVDGALRKISLKDYTVPDADGDTGMDALLKDVNAQLLKEYGTGVDGVNPKVKIEEIMDNGSGTGKIRFDVGNGSSQLIVNGAGPSLGLNSSNINKIDKYSPLSSLKNKFTTPLEFGGETPEDTIKDQVAFKINGVEFKFDQSSNLEDIMTEINNSDAGVTMSYDSLTDKFTLKTKETGVGTKIDIEDTSGNFLEATIGTSSGSFSNGEDMIANIDGVDIIRSSNVFTVNGVTYEAVEPTDEVTIKLELDVDKVYDLIKGFIEDYNTLIGDIDKLITDKYDRNYQPLTAEQKSAMSETQIEQWESKAKTGLLKNDSILQTMLSRMRMAFSDSVEGVKGTLSELGIKTGTYSDKGKIVIDSDFEYKLKEALRDDPDKVMNLFAKKSESYPYASRTYTKAEAETRYKEEGLVNKLYDIIQENISTFRDSDNRKGFLLEKAGILNDTSEATNTLAKELLNYDKEYTRISDMLIRKENQYYKRFASLETAMQQLNSQSNWLTSQISGMMGS